MINYAEQVKENLMDIIEQMAHSAEIILLKNSENNFILNRKLDFKTPIGLILKFVQQRDQLLSFALDESDLNIPHNTRDGSTYFQSNPNHKGFNLLLLAGKT